MAQICPYCGSKYTTDKGISNNTKELSHRYFCDSCGNAFDVATGAQSASGEWLMTFWDTSVYHNFVAVYRAPNGCIQINQKFKDYKTGKESYHSGEMTPLIKVRKETTPTWHEDVYYLVISTKQSSSDKYGIDIYISTVEMNPKLTETARMNDAMKRAYEGGYPNGKFSMYTGWKNEMLVKGRRDYLQSILGNPTYIPSKRGCYIATAVYGSYDCPQVWTLRRFRDNTLASTWYGRAFIRTYYAISPTLVKWFGHTTWFKNLWRGKLDRIIDALQKQGVESTPYQDKNW